MPVGLPSNAGDVSLIPGQVTKIPHVTGQLHLDTTTTKVFPLILQMRSLRLWQLSSLSQVMWLKKTQSQDLNPGPWLSSPDHIRGPSGWRMGMWNFAALSRETSQGCICVSVPAQWISTQLTGFSPKPASTPPPHHHPGLSQAFLPTVPLLIHPISPIPQGSTGVWTPP